MCKMYTIWDSGITNSINIYFVFYIEYIPLEPGETVQVNGIRGIMKTQGIENITLEL